MVVHRGCKRPFIRRLGWVFRVLIQDYAVIGGSRPVSRVLSRTAIHLGCVSPRISSDLPGDSCGHTDTSPYSVLLRVGFTLPQVSPPARCALTAPFHPYRSNNRRYIFCGTFRGLTPPRRYLAPCPKSPDFPPGFLPATV